MMRDPAPFADWRLRCPDVEVAIELDGVAIDDLSAEAIRPDPDREIALARASGTGDNDGRRKSQLTATNLDRHVIRSCNSSPRSGPVAQLGARFHGMEEVKGSNPFRSTKLPLPQNPNSDIRNAYAAGQTCRSRRSHAALRVSHRASDAKHGPCPDKPQAAHRRRPPCPY